MLDFKIPACAVWKTCYAQHLSCGFPLGWCKVPGFLCAQEVAGNHAVALWGRTDAGYATDPIMVDRHLIFAATRIQIRMIKYPKWYDYSSPMQRCFWPPWPFTYCVSASSALLGKLSRSSWLIL